MITSKDVRNKRFEKVAFGYNQDEVNEFFAQLEAELDEMERERQEANNKIQILCSHCNMCSKIIKTARQIRTIFPQLKAIKKTV